MIKHNTPIKFHLLVLGLVFAYAAPVMANDTVPNWKLESELAIQAETSTFVAQTLDLNGTYYFDPVEYTSGPYAERDFLHPTNTLSIRSLFERGRLVAPKYNSYHLGFDSSIVREHHIYQPKAHFTDFAGIKTYGAGMEYAYQLTDTSRVFSGINVNNEELVTGNALVSKANIGYRKLWLYDRGHAFANDYKYEYTNAENESRHYTVSEISTNLDYYFGRRWGLGLNLSYSNSDIKRFESGGLGLSTSYYFNSNVGFEFDVGAKSRERNSIELDISLSSVIRF